MAKRLRWRSVGCKVARNIKDYPRDWHYVGTMGIGQTAIENGLLRVTVAPCERRPCLTLLDQVRLYEIASDGSPQNVFVGPVSRLFLRRAVRRFSGQRVAAM